MEATAVVTIIQAMTTQENIKTPLLGILMEETVTINTFNKSSTIETISKFSNIMEVRLLRKKQKSHYKAINLT